MAARTVGMNSENDEEMVEERNSYRAMLSSEALESHTYSRHREYETDLGNLQSLF